MSRTKTFEFEGWIVSVVPDRQLERARTSEEASQIVRSAERQGGPSLLRELLGQWAPSGPIRLGDLRSLVHKEILECSELWKIPLQESVAFDTPQVVDLRELTELTPLGGTTLEPEPVGAVEPDPWIELEVRDTKGRVVDHFEASMRSAGGSRSVRVSSVVHEELEGTDPVDVTLHVPDES
ncbi:MAG: hypothetical protein AAGA54_22340 [Myxococcota bacterium]